jgi:hypothetical protein
MPYNSPTKQVIISGICTDAIRALLIAQGLGLVQPDFALDKNVDGSLHSRVESALGAHLATTAPERQQLHSKE